MTWPTRSTIDAYVAQLSSEKETRIVRELKLLLQFATSAREAALQVREALLMTDSVGGETIDPIPPRPDRDLVSSIETWAEGLLGDAQELAGRVMPELG